MNLHELSPAPGSKKTRTRVDLGGRRIIKKKKKK